MAGGEPVKFAGVFDLDQTLGDFTPIFPFISFFFPELFFEDGKILFPPEVIKRKTPEEGQLYLQKLWKVFDEYRTTAWIHFKGKLVERELRFQSEEPAKRGCLLRPNIYQYLYTLKNTPGCQGLMILSNNTVPPILELANYMIHELAIDREVAGSEVGPPFIKRLLLDYTHPYRQVEKDQQKLKTGEETNNTSKSLYTVKSSFEKFGNRVFAEEIGTASMPYANSALYKTNRIFFADDLDGVHQLEGELANPGAQFMNCREYTTETTAKELLKDFWSSWLEAAVDETVEKGRKSLPLHLFRDYFKWLWAMKFWSFGPLLLSGEKPEELEAEIGMYIQRCSQYTFKVRADKASPNPADYPELKEGGYSPFESDAEEWEAKLQSFLAQLQASKTGGGSKKRGWRMHIQMQKQRSTRRIIRKRYIRKHLRTVKISSKKMKG